MLALTLIPWWSMFIVLYSPVQPRLEDCRVSKDIRRLGKNDRLQRAPWKAQQIHSDKPQKSIIVCGFLLFVLNFIEFPRVVFWVFVIEVPQILLAWLHWQCQLEGVKCSSGFAARPHSNHGRSWQHGNVLNRLIQKKINLCVRRKSYVCLLFMLVDSCVAFCDREGRLAWEMAVEAGRCQK